MVINEQPDAFSWRFSNVKFIVINSDIRFHWGIDNIWYTFSIYFMIYMHAYIHTYVCQISHTSHNRLICKITNYHK